VLPYVFWDWLFDFCGECHWNFDRDCIEHVDCFGGMAIFIMLILWAWKVFPYSDIFFDFSLQCFTVFIEKIFGFLC
jgi:hypothetical protein